MKHGKLSQIWKVGVMKNLLITTILIFSFVFSFGDIISSKHEKKSQYYKDNLDNIDDIDDTDNNNVILEKLTNMADKIIDYENKIKNSNSSDLNNLIIDEYNEILVPKSKPKSIPKKMMKSKSAISLSELTNSFKQKSFEI